MITYQVEKLETCLEEMKPLLEKHWEEVAWYKDEIDFNPDYDKYYQVEAIGMLHVVTVREDGELIGYNINFINAHLHYSDHKYAVNDIIFLKPEHRHASAAIDLISFTEKELKKLGVSVMTMHMKLAHPFKSLMEHVDFAPQEYVYSKLIGE